VGEDDAVAAAALVVGWGHGGEGGVDGLWRRYELAGVIPWRRNEWVV